MDVSMIVISGILLLFSIVSFIPQYSRILSRRDCAGIAPSYILLNLIVATEQFTICLHYFVSDEDSMIPKPRTPGDWLNLAQFSAVLLCHLVLFGFYLIYSPSTLETSIFMVIIYIAFLLISVAPVIFESTLPPPLHDGEWPNDHQWFSVILFAIHSLLVNPIVTILAVVALFPQWSEIVGSSEAGALSVATLATQAIVFAVVAFFWSLRLTLPRPSEIIAWYLFVGWAAIDNLVFAVVQGILYWISRLKLKEPLATTDETTPLIAERV
ncbi:hypothetical protein F4677DRAFT_289765 [Hypoxylon crocopeplum]|nr:hypothetical protein F4677DRAFT_289765 [Hypoxylon crocopeplum]